MLSDVTKHTQYQSKQTFDNISPMLATTRTIGCPEMCDAIHHQLLSHVHIWSLAVESVQS